MMYYEKGNVSPRDVGSDLTPNSGHRIPLRFRLGSPHRTLPRPSTRPTTEYHVEDSTTDTMDRGSSTGTGTAPSFLPLRDGTSFFSRILLALSFL